MHADDLRLSQRSLGAYLGGGVDDSGYASLFGPLRLASSPTRLSLPKLRQRLRVRVPTKAAES